MSAEMSADMSPEMSAEMSAAVPNHRRTKPGGIKAVTPSNGAVGPTSQIPGLSQSADDKAPAERTGGRRVGIFATDSEYVKLAKAGGQKGLLCHDVVEDEIVVETPKKPYNPPEWFGGPESKSGSKVTSPNGHAKAAAMQPLAAPFGTDNGSVWIETDQVLSPDSVASQIDSLTIAEANKYKRTSYDKKAPPVSMSKLLSFGYIEDENKSPNDDDASSVTTEQTSTIATEDVDNLE